jgi:hypothetical protein
MNEYDLDHKVYNALGEKISIKGLLGRFSDPQFQEDEISRTVAISYANDPTMEQRLEN